MAFLALQAGVAGVLHYARPMADTAAPMRKACPDAGAPYVDITGKREVVQATPALDARARVQRQRRNAAGDSVELRPRTAEAFTPTMPSMAEIGVRSLAGAVPSVNHTPTTGFGAGFVPVLPGLSLLDT